jgi:hypothetical protein
MAVGFTEAAAITGSMVVDSMAVASMAAVFMVAASAARGDPAAN